MGCVKLRLRKKIDPAIVPVYLDRLIAFKELTLTKKEKRLPSVLTKEEVKSLINACSSDKSRMMISLLYACGMRVSELANLKISDLEFNNKIG